MTRRRITYTTTTNPTDPPREIDLAEYQALLKGGRRKAKGGTESGIPPLRASYTTLSAAGWSFAEGPAGCFAFRVVAGHVESTARFPAGGDNLGARYKHVVAAIARGEYKTERNDDEPNPA